MADLIAIWRRLTGRKVVAPIPVADPIVTASASTFTMTPPSSPPSTIAAAPPRRGSHPAQTNANVPPLARTASTAARVDGPALAVPEEVPDSVENDPVISEPPRVRVVSHGGHSRYLGDPIAYGGTSTVFEIAGASHLVAKVFDEEHLATFGSTIEAKVKAQLSKKDQLGNSKSIVWPRTSIYRPDGKWIGYSMPRTYGVLLNRMTFPKLQAKYFPDLDRFNVVHVLLQIIDGVVDLHGQQIYVGDFNFENFVVNTTATQVYFIDTDGYQIDNHPCLFVRPEYIPPEHIDRDASEIVRSPESDSFSLAILLFQALMKMRHPYDTVGGGDLIDNLRDGHFPYGSGGVAPGRDGAIPEGPWYVMWSHLPWDLKAAFIQTFTAGARTPSARLAIEEWRRLLTKYGVELGRGFHDKALLPAQAKLSVYKGKIKPGG